VKIYILGAKMTEYSQDLKEADKVAADDEELSIATSRASTDHTSRPATFNNHGSYEACGVSACGSLRFPGSPPGHGHFSSLSSAEVDKQLLRLPLYSPTKDITENDVRNELYILEVSRLSARDEGFRKMLEV